MSFTFSYKVRVDPNTPLDTGLDEGWIGCESEDCFTAIQEVWPRISGGQTILEVLEFRSVSPAEFQAKAEEYEGSPDPTRW